MLKIKNELVNRGFREIEIKISSKSKSIPDEDNDSIWDLSVNGILVSPKHEEISTPWDADMYIEGSNLILAGSIGPGGPQGRCTCSVPLNNASKYYKIIVEAEYEDDYNKIYNILEKYNWV